MADRGQLRVYLGAAPGVGKTYAMLGAAGRAGHRRGGRLRGDPRPGAHGRALTPARQRDPASWQVAAAGGEPRAAPDDGDTDIPVGQDLALVLRGRPCRPPTGASWKPSPPRRRLRCASSGWPKRPNAPAS